jgi:hypothetical protein
VIANGRSQPNQQRIIGTNLQRKLRLKRSQRKYRKAGLATKERITSDTHHSLQRLRLLLVEIRAQLQQNISHNAHKERSRIKRMGGRPCMGGGGGGGGGGGRRGGRGGGGGIFRSISDEDWEAQGVLQVKALAHG